MTTEGRKDDAGKPRWSLVPWAGMRPVLDVLEHGAQKYGAHAWINVRPERYRESLLRHVVAYAAGERTDADSGLPHLAHAACNALFLLTFENAEAMDLIRIGLAAANAEVDAAPPSGDARRASEVLDALWDTVDPVDLDCDNYASLRELAPTEVAAWVNGCDVRPIVERLRTLTRRAS